MLTLIQLHLEESDIVKTTFKDPFRENMEPFGDLTKLFVNGLQIQMKVNKENK